MPLYYFQIESGDGSADPQGLRLNGVTEARNHARTLEDAIGLRDHRPTRWAIVVTDEHGAVVHEIRHEL